MAPTQKFQKRPHWTDEAHQVIAGKCFNEFPDYDTFRWHHIWAKKGRDEWQGTVRHSTKDLLANRFDGDEDKMIDAQFEHAMWVIDHCLDDGKVVQRLIGNITEQLPSGDGSINVICAAPVALEQIQSRNVLSVAYNEELAYRLQKAIEQDAKLRGRVTVTTDRKIAQVSETSRTDATLAQRLGLQPLFEGTVHKSKEGNLHNLYICTDDDIEVGGTLAAMSGYIKELKGNVIAFSSPAYAPGAQLMAVRPDVRKALDDMITQAAERRFVEKRGGPHRHRAKQSHVREIEEKFDNTLEMAGLSRATLTNTEALVIFALLAEPSGDKRHPSPDEIKFHELLTHYGISLDKDERLRQALQQEPLSPSDIRKEILSVISPQKRRTIEGERLDTSREITVVELLNELHRQEEGRGL